MKSSNFPGRKKQKRIAALERLKAGTENPNKTPTRTVEERLKEISVLEERTK